MKFNVSSKALQQQLAAVSKVINTKNSMSILDNFLLTIEGSVLSITGSDSENTMTATVEIMEVEGNGSIAVPYKRLLDMLKEVSGQALTFYINDESHEIDIRFLNGHFNFMGHSGDEYPVRMPFGEDAHTFSVPAKMIQKGIENTLFAASTETIRPIMTGVLWDITEDAITFVASDTHKLVRYINREGAPGLVSSFIMPAKPAGILRSVLNKDMENVEVTMDSKSATFNFANYSLTCRFINGKYPNYNRVIPQENPFELTIDRVSFLNAMRRVALFASSASSLVRMNLQGDEMLLSSQDLDFSTSAEERLECDYKGNDMAIGFNATYMIEVLNNLQDETVVLSLSDPSRAGIFRPLTQDAEEDVLMLLMPIQLPQ